MADSSANTFPTCERFLLFGFGHRRKVVYQSGTLRDALNGEIIYAWNVRSVSFEPADYRVVLETGDGVVIVVEDEEGVWIEEHGDRRCITRSPVRLPTFAGHPRADLLRALHAELLIHVLPWGPVPNIWVYPRPWYRDSAMMAMALAKTGNAGLLDEWIAGIYKRYDFNNSSAEPDNLGQVLYLASLSDGRDHPVVEKVMAEIPKCATSDHLVGTTDYAQHPVYQTKWLKFGLAALGMDHSAWKIPAVFDSYSALFWMDFRDQHVDGKRWEPDPLRAEPYPYLNWANAHFYGDPPPEPIEADSFPLTREGKGSEANYRRMRIVAPDFATARVCSPHTWHGAEIFLYLLDERVFPQR